MKMVQETQYVTNKIYLDLRSVLIPSIHKTGPSGSRCKNYMERSILE